MRGSASGLRHAIEKMPRAIKLVGTREATGPRGDNTGHRSLYKAITAKSLITTLTSQEITTPRDSTSRLEDNKSAEALSVFIHM